MLSQHVRELRLANSWSQVELANRLNIARQTVSNWENDNIRPSIEMLIRLCRLFNVTTDYLLGLDDVPRISVEGLPAPVVTHLSLLIEDYRKGAQKDAPRPE